MQCTCHPLKTVHAIHLGTFHMHLLSTMGQPLFYLSLPTSSLERRCHMAGIFMFGLFPCPQPLD